MTRDRSSGVAASRDASPGEPGWRRCVERVAAGDTGALGDLYDETSPLVYGLALRILGNSADAEEITLDVFTQVWKTAETFDESRGSVTNWLAMLTRSRAIDRLRSKANWDRRWSYDLKEVDVARAFARREEAAALEVRRLLVETALAELSPSQRRLIELAYFAGFSHAELAARTGLPLGTVKTQIRQAMMKLRELLAPLGEGSPRPV
jgi:RNA polymerase sigma-70 factor (ECF subfamily)